MSRFEAEKSSLSGELVELMTELQATRSLRDRLDQQNKSIYDEMLVLQQQQVNIYSCYSSSSLINQSINEVSARDLFRLYFRGIPKSLNSP